MLPQPPDLKPTIIQMQSAEDEEPQQQLVAEDLDKPKKKRRRSSSSLVSQNEIEKRRREHKTAHSIIEKKRRIRMNREFEALKFIVPACRSNMNTSNNNGEGMYKLTILQATVDYVRYLHEIVQLQSEEISRFNPRWAKDEELEFAKADVDTDAYRNLEKEYNFSQLFDEFSKNASSTKSSNTYTTSTASKSATALSTTPNFTRRSTRSNDTDLGVQESIRQNSTLDFSKFQALPSPIITPELYPTVSQHGSISNSSSSLMSDIQLFQGRATSNPSPFLKNDFQFPKNAHLNTPFTYPMSANTSPQMTGTMDIISESMQHDTETSATKALLSMKGDAAVSNIRSLLN